MISNIIVFFNKIKSFRIVIYRHIVYIYVIDFRN